MKLKQDDLVSFLAWVAEAQKITPIPREAQHTVEYLTDLQKRLRELQRLKAHSVHLELTYEPRDIM